jgi:hypothetical protein
LNLKDAADVYRIISRKLSVHKLNNLNEIEKFLKR